MNALVIATHDGQHLDGAVASVVTAAIQLAAPSGGEVHILVTGHKIAGIASQAAAVVGVSSVLVVDDAAFDVCNAETMARQIVSLARSYRWVLAIHNMLARAALPRAAAMSGAAYLSDVVRTAPDSIERPAYAGAVMTTVRPFADICFMTVRPSSFSSAASAGQSPVTTIPCVAPDTRTRLLSREGTTSSRPDLSRARIVIGGGRGVGSVENMAKLGQLADHLGAAVGASRAAVDAGFAPNTVQIGQTGKTIAPEVYIALGISGAIQHLAGIKDAKCIVAINKDPDAPIFQIADYGVVGDLFESLTALRSGLPASPNT